jgi:hypothetical protein
LLSIRDKHLNFQTEWRFERSGGFPTAPCGRMESVTPLPRPVAGLGERRHDHAMNALLAALPPFVVRFVLAFGFGCLAAALL